QHAIRTHASADQSDLVLIQYCEMPNERIVTLEHEVTGLGPSVQFAQQRRRLRIIALEPRKPFLALQRGDLDGLIQQRGQARVRRRAQVPEADRGFRRLGQDSYLLDQLTQEHASCCQSRSTKRSVILATRISCRYRPPWIRVSSARRFRST